MKVFWGVALACCVASAAGDASQDPAPRPLENAHWIKFPKVGSAFAKTIMGFACGAEVDATTENGIVTPPDCDLPRAKRVLAPVSFKRYNQTDARLVRWQEVPASLRRGRLRHRVVALFREPRSRRRSEFTYFVRRKSFGGFFPNELKKAVDFMVFDDSLPLETRWRFYAAATREYRGCMTNMLLGRKCFASTPSARESARALRLVGDDMEFVGLQHAWATTVCLFHATYGGRVWPNEAAVEERTPLHVPDNAMNASADPDVPLFAAAEARFAAEVAGRAAAVGACEATLASKARKECSDTPPWPARPAVSTCADPSPPEAVENGLVATKSPRDMRWAARVWPYCVSAEWRDGNVCHATCRALGFRDEPCPAGGCTDAPPVVSRLASRTCAHVTAAELWVRCNSNVWIERNLCHKTCHEAGFARNLTCPGVATKRREDVFGGGAHTTCRTGSSDRPPGPSGEVWAPCDAARDATNAGGARAEPVTVHLGWLQVSHTPLAYETRFLWMYAAERSNVWYLAGKTLVCADMADLYAYLGADVPPGPMWNPYKNAQLRHAKQRLVAANYSTIVFAAHVDGCDGCWAADRRVVEIVSLEAFSATACPVSARFRRSAGDALWRKHLRHAYGMPALPAMQRRGPKVLGLQPCNCTVETAAPWGRGLVC